MAVRLGDKWEVPGNTREDYHVLGGLRFTQHTLSSPSPTPSSWLGSLYCTGEETAGGGGGGQDLMPYTI